MTPTDDEKKTYYQILGVGKKASEVEIIKAYKRLALKLHPDRPHRNEQEKLAATEDFKAMSNAYQVLIDPDLRKVYDSMLEAASGTPRWTRNSRGGFASRQPSSASSEPRSKTKANFSKKEEKQRSTPPPESSYQRQKYQGSDPPRSTSNPKTGEKARIFGLRKDGEPCLRCQKQCGFCFQHKDQQHQQQKTRENPNRHRSQSEFGVRADGMPCKRCINQGRFCYQHVHQK